jgi:glycerate 2-kinase
MVWRGLLDSNRVLSLDSLRSDARSIFTAGLQSADPFAAIVRTLELREDSLRVADRTYELSAVQNIFVAGCGKAAARMALAVQALLGERLVGGVIVVKHGHQLPIERVKVIEAGHPIPDEAGLGGARQVMDLARSCGKKDLLFFLVSGGGSALLPYPAAGLSLEDKRRTTAALLRSGAKIQEVNAVRKHISQIKGGRLARLAAPAMLVTLVLSDVINDSLEAIASGPTVPDSSTYADCLRIIKRYGVERLIPFAVVDFLEGGANGQIAETPKPSDTVFRDTQNVIVGGNRLALAAAQHRAQALGYHTLVLSDELQGESRIVAKSHSDLVKEFLQTKTAARRPACLLSGGETTVTVRGDGLGGRNQEFSLAAAIEIDGIDGVVILSGGTDGTDGPTDAAGGIVDGCTIDRGRAKNLDAAVFLAQNDSYHFLQATEDLLVTGPTLTNVMDLQITLIA